MFCGSLLRNWNTWGVVRKGTIIGLIVYCVVSVLSYFPYYIPYFNELVLDRTQSYKILADSNIEWSHGHIAFDRYQAQYPDIIIDPDGPVAGRVVINVNKLVGLFDPEKYRWLRENFKPIDHIAYEYLIYEITTEELAERLKSTF